MKFVLTSALLLCFYLNYGQYVCPKDHFVVLPFDRGTYTTLPKNSRPSILNDSDLVRIDQIVERCIRKYNIEQAIEYRKMNEKFPENHFRLRDFVIDLKKYYRQYIVIKNASGEKEVWVNCFCSSEDLNIWKKEIIFVDDGGNCFFNLKINLTRKSYANLMVNGVA